jgi:type III pantothenate kinase
MHDDGSNIVLVSVGNTRTRLAGAHVPAGASGLLGVRTAGSGELQPSRVVASADLDSVVAAVGEAARDEGASRVLIASVNDPVAARLERALLAGEASIDGLVVGRFGRDIPIPIASTLTDNSTVGQDRLLNALGAYWRSRQACIVIDAGTAVTVDFVDGEGTFHGGAIAPGLRMMADALHEKTAALPRVEVSPALLRPAGEPPFGRNTPEAISLGVTSMVLGLVHLLIDRYADFYEAYPRVIATGGDAPLLFENDALVEHIVPDLTLLGMLAAWTVAAADDSDDDDDATTEGD